MEVSEQAAADRDVRSKTWGDASLAVLLQRNAGASGVAANVGEFLRNSHRGRFGLDNSSFGQRSLVRVSERLAYDDAVL